MLSQTIVTFAMVSLAWMFFRGESVRQSLDLIRQMIGVYNPWILTDGSLFTLGLDAKEWNVLLIGIAFLLIVDIFRYKKVDLVSFFMEQNLWFRWILFYVGIIIVVLFGVYGARYNAAGFIYFQF